MIYYLVTGGVVDETPTQWSALVSGTGRGGCRSSGEGEAGSSRGAHPAPDLLLTYTHQLRAVTHLSQCPDLCMVVVALDSPLFYTRLETAPSCRL